MATPKSGDLLLVKTTGAYGSSMASNYNTRPRAAEVLVSGTSVKLIRKRESLESLWELELCE
jgi:diaminopimelate decarboxylase